LCGLNDYGPEEGGNPMRSKTIFLLALAALGVTLAVNFLGHFPDKKHPADEKRSQPNASRSSDQVACQPSASFSSEQPILQQSAINASGQAVRFDFSLPFLTNLPVKPPTETNEAFAVRAERSYARPGERWVEIECRMQNAECRMQNEGTSSQESEVGGLVSDVVKDLQLTAEVFAKDGNKPLAQAAITPPRAKGKVLVDLRSLNLKEARLVLKLSEGGKEIGKKELMLSAQEPEKPLRVGEKVKILLDVPEGLRLPAVGGDLVQWPLMIGVPFPPGALWSADYVRLVDKNGKEIPSQKEVTGLWAPEGAIKWLRFDALVTPEDGCFVEVIPTPSQKGHPSSGGELSAKSPPGRGGGAGVGKGPMLTLTEQDGKITIDTGVAKYVLGKGISPIEEIYLGGKQVATSKNTRGLYVVDQAGRIGSASAEEESMEIEAKGPIASCVRFEGWYKTEKGENLARHITRVECFAGQAFAKVTHTLVLCNSTTNCWFKDIGLEFAVATGSNPQALFAISRADPQKSLPISLNSETATTYLLQDQHYLMAHGTNHFFVATINQQGKTDVLLEGEAAPLKSGKQTSKKAAESPVVPPVETKGEGECGDWSALSGAKGGLMLACKEAARQHPKEFEISSGNASFLGGGGLTTGRKDGVRAPRLQRTYERDEGVPSPVITLHLFSSRGGEELDFRAATLVRKWDLVNWYKKSGSATDDAEKKTEAVKAHASDAIGWAKTHQLLVSPLAPDKPAETAARLSKLFSEPVYALADPWWVYETKAMGPMYPQDKKHFPDVEQAMELVMNYWLETDRLWGANGFVDYLAGPHINYSQLGIAAPYRYCWVTYGVRTDIWRMYARSGCRAYRDFCEGTTRSYLDNIHMHWNPLPGSSLVRGLIRREWDECFNLPFYWGNAVAFDLYGSSDFHNYMWFYYLSGERRVKDVMEEYARGAKQGWNTGLQGWERVIMITRLLAQSYEFLWDPEMRALTDKNTDLFYDPACPMHIGNKMDGGAYYKIFSNVRGLIDAWEIMGSSRYQDLAMRAGEFSWLAELGTVPNGWEGPYSTSYSYNPGMASFGNFLYTQTGEPRYAQAMEGRLRQLVPGIIAGASLSTQTMTATPKPYYGMGANQASFIMQSDLVLDALVRSGADTNVVSSWVAYKDMSCDGGAYARTSVIFQRNPNAPITLYFKNPYYIPWVTNGEIRLRCLESRKDWDIKPLIKRNEVDTGAAAAAILRIPKDTPARDKTFELTLSTDAGYILADARIPMVLHAPGYWKPPTPARYYFNLPGDSKDAQIFFEGPAKLFDPAGTLFSAGGTNVTVIGWVNLPVAKPGFWSFELAKDWRAVHVRNIPPFFAVGNSNLYFTPDISWTREPLWEPVREIPPGTTYVPGAGSAPGNQALYLDSGKTFKIPAGLPADSSAIAPRATAEALAKAEDGSIYLPCQEGTIEFFMKPGWDSLDPATKLHGTIHIFAAEGADFCLSYNRDFVSPPYNGEEGIIGAGLKYLGKDHKEQKADFSQKGVVFEHDKWAHVAVVWGKGILAVFINGKLGGIQPVKIEGGPATAMKALVINGKINAALDELRISDVARYTGTFNPPPPGREFIMDKHTRALFHFNGNVEGQCSGQSGPVMGELK
jgi:hypothetical protein